MLIIDEHQVSQLAQAQRLSDYCIGIFASLPSRKRVKNAIKAGRILLNQQPGHTGDWVKQGDHLQLLAPIVDTPSVYEMKLEIIYEDDYIALINKPAGIPVSGNQFRTIQNSLLGNLQASKQVDALPRPTPVHRLDSLTAGLLIIAKTALAQLHLGKMLSNRTIQKEYQAIVSGLTPNAGNISTAIEGKTAYTDYKKIKACSSLKNTYLSHLALTPTTGRTHQLRIHLSQMGFPIMGDPLYGEPGKIYKGKGLFLAATSLQFAHPISHQFLHFQIDPPTKFEKLLAREKRMWERYQKGKTK